MNTAIQKQRSRGSEKSAPRLPRLLLGLALPTLALLPPVLASTFWHLPTRVQIELGAARLAFTTPDGEARLKILNRSVPFSSLVIEECGGALFAAEQLEVADPRQLVPGAEAGHASHYPPTAWHKLAPISPVQLWCHDPAAKLTLQHTGPAATQLGLLDELSFEPGSQVILEVSPGQEPALSLEIETPQRLIFALNRDLEIVTDHIDSAGIAVPFPGNLLTWRARLPETRRTLEVTSSRHGLVLMLTAPRDRPTQFFREPLDLPLNSVELLEEDLEGALTSSLRDKASLSYPSYPGIPPVTIERDEALALGRLSKSRLTRLSFDAEKGILRVRFDGIAGHATSKSGEFARDHRLTLFHTFRHSWRWELVAIVAAWLLSTTWAAFGVWKKLKGDE